MAGVAVLRIQVLGPVRAWRGGAPLDLGPAAQRAVLGLLALASGQPLPRSEIMSGVWPDREPPASAANVIQTHVKHLRRLLEPERPPRAPSTVLRQVGDGYALHVPAGAVDLLEFRRRVAAAAGARRGGELSRAAELLEEALALWNGSPLADVPLLSTHPKVVALAGERQAALGRFGEMLIAAGRAAEALPALEEAAATQPMDEAGQARLIRAYHGAGRRGQAFATYHEVRRRLIDELGVAPGAELSAAHTALLHDEEPPSAPAPAAPPPRPAPAPAPPPPRPAPAPAPPPHDPVPAQLPADVPAFVGQVPELSELAGGYRICVVSGTAGVGKTTLAVHLAHEIAHRFPDGQLYLNLRGFDPAAAPMDPATAMRRFLDALEVPAERIPSDLDAQAALYRSRLAGRRMLVVLDNARDAAQVRPLLPGAPGCLVLITSRAQLSSLVAAEGARAVPLDLLTAAEARELLIRRVGADRAADDPEAVAEILDHCAGLPLAIAVVAARAVINRGRPLGTLARQLSRDADRLDALTTGDPGTDLRAVLSWSYRALSPEAARLFRLLGLHPGPDVSVPAAASLAGRPAGRVRELLAELVGANLIAEHAPGRYDLHDLLRAYAAETAGRIDRERARRSAARRVLDHYMYSAHAADRLLNPARDPIALTPAAQGVEPEAPADHEEAVAWFAVERAVLLAALEHATAAHAWRLAWALTTFLDQHGHWDDLAASQRAGAAAARREGDPTAEANAYRLLARAHTRLGRLDDAHAELTHALHVYERAGDWRGQGETHLNLALVWDRRRRHRDALDCAERSLAVFEAHGNRNGQARAHNAIGWYHALLGRHEQALIHCGQALDRLRQAGDRSNLASTWDSLGYAHHHLGHEAESIACYHRAVRIYRAIGDRHLEGMVLSHLGDAYDTFANPTAAHTAWREALERLGDLDLPEAERISTKLMASVTR